MKTRIIMHSRELRDVMETEWWDFPPRADAHSFDGGLVIKGYIVDPADIEALDFLGGETARVF